MSDAGDPDVTRLLRDLTRELQTLQRELDEGDRGRLPSGGQLSRFTSEVAIPGVILLLETNIRALQLLRRTIRLADGRDPRGTGGGGRTAGELRSRAEQLGQTTLVQLDNALAEVQESLDEREDTDEASQLLEDARQLQARIRNQLAESEAESTDLDPDDEETDRVDIDVDAELRTLKDNLEDDSPDSNGANGGADSSDDGEGTDGVDGDGGTDDGGNP